MKKSCDSNAYCNASGDKLPLLFIHKFNTPRTLKGISKASLPVYYYWSKNAWMQTSIFQHWLRKLNADKHRNHRKILSILDNASLHKWNEDEELSNVELLFLPPNTTAHLQPCDAGIIWSFKSHSRKLL